MAALRLGLSAKDAIRSLKRTPGYSLAVVLTLGLGVGANTAMFGIVDRLMLRPFPSLRDPQEVHAVYQRFVNRGELITTQGPGEYARYEAYRRWTTSFSQWAVFREELMAVGDGADVNERQVAAVSASFFDFFDARPALGRFLVATDDQTPRGADVAVISWELWQNRFGGRDVLGSRLSIGNISARVVGVAPRGFIGVFDSNPPAAYIPITTFANSQATGADRQTYFTHYGWGRTIAIVRRRKSVSLDAASADVAQAYQKSWEEARTQNPRLQPVELARPTALVGPVKAAMGPSPSPEARTVQWVALVALIVLVITSANVANLLLARALLRRRENAVRVALGGRFFHLAVRSAVEAMLVAIGGLAVALMVAQFGGYSLRQFFAGEGAQIEVATDWRTLIVTMGLSMMVALLASIAPAVLATRGDLADELRAGARNSTRRRSGLRQNLQIAQVALSVTLLVAAGLFVRSVIRLRTTHLGFEPSQVLVIGRNLRGTVLSDSGAAALEGRMLDAAESVPGVVAAATTNSVPVWFTASTDLRVPGIDSIRQLGVFTYTAATTGYFTVLGTRVLRGRSFDKADLANAEQVALVSDAMAGRLWPGKDPIGRCIQVGAGADATPCRRVVGVVENSVLNMFATADDDRRMQYYLPLDQYRRATGAYLIVRVRGEAGASASAVRAAVQRTMPGQSYATVRLLEDIVALRQRSWRFASTMFVTFGILGLLVAAIGLYGLMSYDMTERTREFGIRAALGATKHDIVVLAIRHAFHLAFVGLAIGVIGAVALAPLVQPLLFRQNPLDPWVFVGVCSLLASAVLSAAYFPAHRAGRTDPRISLGLG